MRKAKRLLATLMALAMLVTMIPVMPTAAEAAVPDKVTVEKMRPEGITIDLFDYWLTTQDGSDVNDPQNVMSAGINNGHALKFGKDLGSLPNIEEFNKWTGNASPRTGIVQQTLDDEGYPVLAQGTVNQSLDYLFNAQPNVDSKAAYTDVGGLLTQDDKGYYSYNSTKNFASFDERTKNFTLYADPAVSGDGVSGAGGNGMFFPFNTADEVFTNDDSWVKSNAEMLNHYFGLHMTTSFQQTKGGVSPSNDQTPVTFSFSGDDDVWIFIDDVLVADLGGIHNACSVEINFQTGDIYVYEDNNDSGKYDEGDTRFNAENTTLKTMFAAAGAEGDVTWADNGSTFADETYHTLDFFYLERGNVDSNMKMNYNLKTVPESDLIKVDQDGEKVKNAVFELYGTDTNYSDTTNDADKLVAEGTTDENGVFTFKKPDGDVLPLNQLQADHYLLVEKDVPEGYRNGDAPIKLYVEKAGNKNLLLSENEWETGAYAMPKVRISALTDGDGNISGNQSYNVNNGLIVAAVFKGDDVPYGQDPNDLSLVYGDPVNGWNMANGDSATAQLQNVAARMQSTDMKGIYAFSLDSSGAYTTDIENLPGDIKKYSWMVNETQQGVAEYMGAYFFVEGAGSIEDIANEDPDNIHLLDSTGFERDFSVRLYAPNINNRLLVQKTNEDGTQALEGATFELYEQSDLNVEADGSWTKANDTVTPVKQVDTQANYLLTEGQTVPGANAMMNIPLGTYYLVETKAPTDYNLNPQAIKVVVDNTGVHVDAGTAEDDITVTLGVGKIVKSMVQFAVDDGIDASLHDITATLQTSEDYNENTQWTDTKQSMALSYAAEDLILEYGPASAGGETILSYNEGWGRLNITQTNHATTANGSPKQDLSNQPLNNLFSGTTIVTVGDAKKTPGNVSITKTVQSSVTSDQDETFDVQLSVPDGNFHGGDIYQLNADGTQTKLEFTDNKTTLEIKNSQTINLNVPAGVQLKVEEVNPGSAFEVSYAVDTNTSSTQPVEVTVGEKGSHNITITNERTSGGSVVMPGKDKLSITKNVTGGDWPDDEAFTFIITGENGAPLPKDADGSEQDSITISRPADGSNTAAASFDDITFTQTGKYVYTITENKGDADNMTYDDHKLTVTVTVGKDAAGALQIESVSYDSSVDADDEAAARTFTNIIGKEEPDNPGGGWIPGGGGDPDTPDLNTEDHFSYIVGYPEDYRTGEATDDESLWPVKPQGNITRAEVATIFYRLLTDEARTEHWTRSNDYSDVAAESWYNTPVSTLSAMGIVNGYEDGSFRPNAPITRAEFAAIAVRFFENDNVDYEEGLFTDITGSEWFADAVAAAQENGIVGGYPDGSFQPNKAITRAEACSIVNRTVDRIPDKDHLLPEDEMRVWPDNSDPDIWYYADMQEATSGHDYEWILDDNDEPLCEQWTGDLPEVDWVQVEIDQEEKHGLR